MKEIERTIEHEGGYSNDESDFGNWTGGKPGVGELKGTNFGISAKSYPTLDIKNLTKEDAIAIYIRDFWKYMKLDLLTSSRVRFKVFDIGVNMGTGTAIRLLQDVVGTTEDGAMGADTADHANKMGEMKLLEGLVRVQVMRYATIASKNSTQIGNLCGWIKRAFDTGEGL
jgi:lysozyme family protein